MKKKLVICVMMLMFTSVSMFADGIEVILQTGIFDKDIANPYPKSPTRPPQIEQNGCTLYFVDAHTDYTLCLLDENNEVVYTNYIPLSVSTVFLPDYLQGTYEIRLLTDSVYFYGWITL